MHCLDSKLACRPEDDRIVSKCVVWLWYLIQMYFGLKRIVCTRELCSLHLIIKPPDSHVWPTCINLVTPSIEHGHVGKVWITVFSYKISRARLLTCSVYGWLGLKALSRITFAAPCAARRLFLLTPLHCALRRCCVLHKYRCFRKINICPTVDRW